MKTSTKFVMGAAAMVAVSAGGVPTLINIYLHTFIWRIRHNSEICNISEYGSERFVAQPPVNYSLTIKPSDYKNNGSYATVINLLSKGS